MKKKILLFGGFFIVLMTFFYFLLFSGTDYYKVKLPVMNFVENFSFVDQDGKQISEHDIDGKVYVADYFLLHVKEYALR
jgi:protein SCO1/2